MANTERTGRRATGLDQANAPPRPPQPDVAAQRPAGELHRARGAHADRGLQPVVEAVVHPQRPDVGLGVLEGLRGRAADLVEELRLVGDVGQLVLQARALEEADAAPVGDDAALLALDALLAAQQVVVKVAHEELEAGRLRAVEQPGHVVRHLVDVAHLAGLDRHPEVLAAAEEVLRLHRELAEEAVELAPAAAEEQLGAVRLLAVDGEVDRLALAVRRVELDRVVLVDLEVGQLVELVDAVLERPHVHDQPFLQAELAAQHLVAGAVVALELDAADLELVALEDLHLHVGDVVGALDELDVDLGVDVAAVAVQLLDRLDPLVDRRGAQPGAVRAAEGAQQDLVGVDLVSLDGHGAELPAVALDDRDGELEATLLPLGRRLGVLGLHRHPRLGDVDVLVALLAVEVADLAEVLLDRRRVVDVVLQEPRDRPRLLGLAHREAQPEIGEDGIALEVDVADLDLGAFVDGEAHAALAGAHLFDGVVDGGEAVPLLGVHLHQLVLGALELAEVDGAALAQADLLFVEAVLDVGAAERLQPLALHRAQYRALDDAEQDVDPGGRRRRLDRDVVEQVAVPERLHVLVERDGVEGGADLEAEVVAEGLLGERAQALVLHCGDRLAGQTVGLGGARRHT